MTLHNQVFRTNCPTKAWEHWWYTLHGTSETAVKVASADVLSNTKKSAAEQVTGDQLAKALTDGFAATAELLSRRVNADTYVPTNKQTRGGEIVGEIYNATTIITDVHKCNPLNTSPLRQLSQRYAIGELMYYLSATNDLGPIANYAKTWKSLSDNGETVNSAYGHRLHKYYGFDQWEVIRRLLQHDPNSRRAIMHLTGPNDDTYLLNSKDVPCTLNIQFQLEKVPNQNPNAVANSTLSGATSDQQLKPAYLLHMTTTMRSNDLWYGFPYDLFYFLCLQIKMAMELSDGPKQLVLPATYTHHAGNLHLYSCNAKTKSKEKK